MGSRSNPSKVAVNVWPDGVYVERDGVFELVDYTTKDEPGRVVLNLSGRLPPQELAEAAVDGSYRVWRQEAARRLRAGRRRCRQVPVVGRIDSAGGQVDFRSMRTGSPVSGK